MAQKNVGQKNSGNKMLGLSKFGQTNIWVEKYLGEKKWGSKFRKKRRQFLKLTVLSEGVVKVSNS